MLAPKAGAGWKRQEHKNVENAEGVQELSPGWRLGGTLGIGSKKARSSKGAKESVERRAINAAQFSKMTISCDVAGFLPLLQSGPRLTLNTQGSAKPPPWAKFLYAFGVHSSQCRPSRRSER
jgi:hypothetical protein